MSDVNVVQMFSEIAAKVEKNRKLPVITSETSVSSLGIDSVSMMEIVGSIEDELNISIPDEKLAQLQTVKDIERVVAEQLNA